MRENGSELDSSSHQPSQSQGSTVLLYGPGSPFTYICLAVLLGSAAAAPGLLDCCWPWEVALAGWKRSSPSKESGCGQLAMKLPELSWKVNDLIPPPLTLFFHSAKVLTVTVGVCYIFNLCCWRILFGETLTLTRFSLCRLDEMCLHRLDETT